MIMCLASGEGVPLPQRWLPYLDNIKFYYAPLDHFGPMDGRLIRYADHRRYSYTLVDPDADISIICDADTLLLQRFEDEFFEDMTRHPAIGAVLAHHPPEVTDELGHDYRSMTNDQFWHAISSHVLGAPVPLNNRYILADDMACPFYVNNGFVAAPPRLMLELHRALCVVQPKIREFLDNIFYGQISVALAVELAGLPTRALPVRYNYPNTNVADEKYASELSRVRLLHYQRTDIFDRHKIFVDAEAFNSFVTMNLGGSNAVFQRRIRELTGGIYPFPPRSSA
jgi:hypothetical protein